MGYVYVKNKPKTSITEGGSGVLWADEKKLQVLKKYLSCGNYRQTARDCVVPLATIEGWRQQDWWKDGIKDIREGNLTRLDAKITETIDHAIDNIVDRITQGETVYDPRTGKQRVVPAKLRDLTTAFNSMIDKRQLIRKEPTRIVEQHSTAQQLQALATHFEQFVTGRIKEEKEKELIQYIEGETVVQDENTGEWHVQDPTL